MGGSWQSGQQRTYSQDCSFKDSLYRVGDYVYVESSETSLQPHIICIERLWQDHTGGFPPGHVVQCPRWADGGSSRCFTFISRIGVIVEVPDHQPTVVWFLVEHGRVPASVKGFDSRHDSCLYAHTVL